MTPPCMAEKTSLEGIGAIVAPRPLQIAIHKGISGMRILMPSSSSVVLKLRPRVVVQRAPW